MARHRNVRKMDYSEEYGYDDVYGRSLEEEVAVSPSTEAQFIYQRDSRQGPSLMSYIETRDTGRRRQQSSPLTTSTATAATTTASSGHRDHKADVPPPPGFRPIQRGAGVTITTKDPHSSDSQNSPLMQHAHAHTPGVQSNPRGPTSLSDLISLHAKTSGTGTSHPSSSRKQELFPMLQATRYDQYGYSTAAELKDTAVGNTPSSLSQLTTSHQSPTNLETRATPQLSLSDLIPRLSPSSVLTPQTATAPPSGAAGTERTTTITAPCLEAFAAQHPHSQCPNKPQDQPSLSDLMAHSSQCPNKPRDQPSLSDLMAHSSTPSSTRLSSLSAPSGTDATTHDVGRTSQQKSLADLIKQSQDPTLALGSPLTQNSPQSTSSASSIQVSVSPSGGVSSDYSSHVAATKSRDQPSLSNLASQSACGLANTSVSFHSALLTNKQLSLAQLAGDHTNVTVLPATAQRHLATDTNMKVNESLSGRPGLSDLAQVHPLTRIPHSSIGTASHSTFSFEPFGLQGKSTSKPSDGLSLSDLAKLHTRATTSPTQGALPHYTDHHSSVSPTLSLSYQTKLSPRAQEGERKNASLSVRGSPAVSVSASQSSITPSLTALAHSHLGTSSSSKFPGSAISRLNEMVTNETAEGMSTSVMSPPGFSHASSPSPHTNSHQFRDTHDSSLSTIASASSRVGPAMAVDSQESPILAGLSLSDLTRMHLSPSTQGQSLMNPPVSPLIRTIEEMQLQPLGPSQVDSQMGILLHRVGPYSRVEFQTVEMEPRHKYFALVMQCSQDNSRVTKRASRVRSKVLQSLAREFLTNLPFDFSSPSPDDVVRQRQKKGFAR